jgi:hypothetical protein
VAAAGGLKLGEQTMSARAGRVGRREGRWGREASPACEASRRRRFGLPARVSRQLLFSQDDVNVSLTCHRRLSREIVRYNDERHPRGGGRRRADLAAERAPADAAIAAFASLADKLDALAAERSRPWWKRIMIANGRL